MPLKLHNGSPTSERTPWARRQQLYETCWRGELPAEVLDTAAREHLLYDLWRQGWTDADIAAHTRMTTYTAARIRARLGLVARTQEGNAA